MPRRSVNSQPAVPAVAASGGGPIVVLGVDFGLFERITSLNDRFIEGRDRLKLTVDLRLHGRASAELPAASLRSLQQMFPGLRRHLCCGDSAFQWTFLRGAARQEAGVTHDDETVNIAHLLEHLVIEFHHAIASMRVCSGVTCGYENPRHRFDIFVESPGRSVSLVSVRLALRLMDDLLAGSAPSPLYPAVVNLARHFHAAPWALVTARTAALATHTRLGGAEEALETLADFGHIERIDPAVNFSRVDVFALVRQERPWGDLRPQQALT